MNAYASRKHVYRYGLARGTLGMNARLVASALAATDTLELDDHGFETDDPILVRATEGGTLSPPLVAGTTYYAIRANDSTFQLAAAPGGSPINLTSDGASMLVATPLPFDEVLEAESRFVDGCLPAHMVPLEPDDDGNYPVVVTATVAKLAAKELQRLSGQSSASVDAARADAETVLKTWAKGVPIRDAKITPSANKAVTLSAASDARGWGSGGIP